MYCSQCGKQIQDDAKFCYSCGAEVGAEIASNTDAQTETDQNTAHVEELNAAAKADLTRWGNLRTFQVTVILCVVFLLGSLLNKDALSVLFWSVAIVVQVVLLRRKLAKGIAKQNETKRDHTAKILTLLLGVGCFLTLFGCLGKYYNLTDAFLAAFIAAIAVSSVFLAFLEWRADRKSNPYIAARRQAKKLSPPAKKSLKDRKKTPLVFESQKVRCNRCQTVYMTGTGGCPACGRYDYTAIDE